jgi:Leucine-rich repeat (LRR) protein
MALLLHFPTLKRVDLFGAPVTDKCLKDLAALTELEYLNLKDTKVGDATLTALKGLTKLRALKIGSGITDAGLANLKDFKQLQQLDLQGDRFTDAGLAHLKNLTELRRLELMGEKFSDAGLAPLKELTHLEWLGISSLKISDKSIPHLRALKKLRILRLYLSSITPEGVAELQKALPQAKIITKD